ncbi:MAG: hypothetical protein LBH41_02795, partial [Rickettsiales bacterium]|nr:hypothetical protein [Rickettsiales bacterium]
MRKLAFIAALALGFPVRAQVPGVLYGSDIDGYKRIFELQEKGRWAAADKAVKGVKNDILMGYVLHQRYMSPYYATKFSEARDWTRKYYDMPNAGDIYRLGLRKGAKKELRAPKREASRASYYEDASAHRMIQSSYARLSKADRNQVDYMIRIFNRRLRRGYTKNAREILENPMAKKLFSRGDYLRMEAALAFAYFQNAMDDMAVLWAREPAAEIDYYLANWTLGLVYWRAGDYARSRDCFKAVAWTGDLTSDVAAAGAYWAWRANERLPASGREDGDSLLERAAGFPKTFYGILAGRQLGRALDINWDEPEFTLAHARELLAWNGGTRA